MLQGGQTQRFLLLQMNKRFGFLAILLACSSMAMASDVWTLERAINYALSHNPDAQIAQQRIAVAQAGLDQANAAFWPRMQVQSGYMRTDNPMMVAIEEVVGTVRPKLRSDIEAKVSGRIEQMRAVPGQLVKRGELLVQLDAREIQAKLDQATASRDQAESDLVRYTKLIAQHAITQQEFEASQSRARIARASVTEAETMLGYTKITAPFNGVITSKLSDVGDLAAPGRPLLKMEDPHQLPDLYRCLVPV